MLGLVCGSDLENAKGTRNNNLARVLHHLSKTEKPLGLACSLRTSTSKLVLAPDGFDVGAAQHKRCLSGPLTLEALCTRSSRSLSWRRQVSLSIFSATLSVCELPTLTFAVPVAIDRVAPFSTRARQARMRQARMARCKDTCFRFDNGTANPFSEKAEGETLLRCTRVVFVQDGKRLGHPLSIATAG